ncbi:hypothetical protein HYW46_00475 [Candidatus Daviesbacteria bacterium]|nr:hypothetical protein [Candidatus Daviesbacteria bacterium]
MSLPEIQICPNSEEFVRKYHVAEERTVYSEQYVHCMEHPSIENLLKIDQPKSHDEITEVFTIGQFETAFPHPSEEQKANFGEELELYRRHQVIIDKFIEGRKRHDWPCG